MLFRFVQFGVSCEVSWFQIFHLTVFSMSSPLYLYVLLLLCVYVYIYIFHEVQVLFSDSFDMVIFSYFYRRAGMSDNSVLKFA